MNPLLYLGHERALEHSDLYPLSKGDATKVVATLFNGHWEKQLEKAEYVSFMCLRACRAEGCGRPSYFKAIVASFGLPFAIAGAIKLVADILTFAGPILLNRIVVFISSKNVRVPVSCKATAANTRLWHRRPCGRGCATPLACYWPRRASRLHCKCTSIRSSVWVCTSAPPW